MGNKSNSGFRQTSEIVCPHCSVKQQEDLYGYTDNFDMEGAFEMNCDTCKKPIKVEFKLLPYVNCEKVTNE